MPQSLTPTMKNISKEKVLNLRIPNHNPAEQQRVANALDALREKLVQLAAVRKTSERAVTAVLPSLLYRAYDGVAR